MRLLFVVLTALIIFPNQSKAAFLFEPVWGANKGQYVEGTNSGTFTRQFQAIRLGYVGRVFFAGFEGSFGIAKFDESFLDEGRRFSYNTVDLNIIMGLRLWYFRFYVVHGASNLRKNDANPNKRTYYGDVYKLGFSFNIIWRLHLNYENVRVIYDEYEETRAQTLKISPFDIESDLLSLSLVFGF